MSLTRSLKNRLRHLSETHGLFRPIGGLFRILLAWEFEISSFVQRLGIFIQLLKIRVQYGKKLIVIYRGIGIGDIVCTFPLIVEIRKQYPDHSIVYVTNRPSRAFVEKFSGADAAVATSYVFYAQRLPQLPAWMVTKAHFPQYQGERHEDSAGPRTGYILEMAASFGILLSEPRPAIVVEPSRAAALLRRVGANESHRPFIGIHLGPSMPVREYPFDLWQELARRLHSDFGATVFRFGSKSHHTAGATGAEAALDVQFDLTDRLELVETTELLSAMNLFIGIDSGILHIANAVKIPTIGLFGPTDPAIVLSQTTGVGLFAKEMPCLFCQHRHLNLHWNTGCPFDIQCMRLISVDSILLQVKSILETSGLLPIKAT